MSNCSFSGNFAFSLGGALYFGTSSESIPSPTVNNCNLWGNDAVYNGDAAGSFEIWLGGYADPEVNYSDVQGGFPGTANIDADPLWVETGYWDDNGTPEDDEDDFWVEGGGDYNLLPGSPVIDAADNTAVPGGVMTDRDGNPRFIEDANTPDTGLGDCPMVDMGSYEFQEGTTDCCPWDLDGSGSVGVSDLLFLLGTWGPCPKKGDCPADFDNSGDVGVKDLLFLLGAWGPCP